MIKRPFILTAAVCILLCAGCAKKEETGQKEEVIPVKAMRVKLKDIAEVLEYTGNIKAQDEAVIYPKVSGKIIEKKKEDGAAVAKGEPILYIDRDEVGFTFEKAPVESPIDGIVGRIYVDIGSNVTIQDQVALIVNMDKVKITLDIPEFYLPKISVNQKAKITLDAYPDEIFEGYVSKISPVLDIDTRSAPLEITVDNKEHLLNSGMFARVSLVLSEHKAVPVILKEGIVGHEPNLYIFVIEENKAFLRKITLGIRQGQFYEVTSGLKENDLVVVLGQQRLAEGSVVIAEEAK
ncbi:MAG: efflux RND transporter periplasmic adaptor subunit [Candidatus Omnitrophica bacterium]|nr:efflux RND transporter periplasmic adaptor subunit [Candidatus Omnitrophota bacterium]MDD5553068.1 efflux RND transporter periplasmic adaptor subunit [Candidatus Omnitrophota bacterium]